MKLPFTIYDLRHRRPSRARDLSEFTIESQSAAAINRQSAIGNRQSKEGVALIITLILLSVVTIMAVTFLAISRRERGAVATVTDTAGARFAADAALANAEAQIMANVLASTNPFNFGLLVSTNYINPLGFRPGRSSFTNVNYDRLTAGGPLNQAAFLQNLTNLWYSPRPPVFISTNPSAPPDFRYYIDLNRNGRFDPNDNETNYDNNGNPLYDASGLVITNSYVGDPEWIGVLERPDAPYGPDNRFIARYAFIALPIGNTLDLNAIHNQALNPILNYPLNPMNSVNGTEDGYFRNQGVGSWELNLAAFLADLNTNQWGQAINDPLNTSYYYYKYPGGGNRGFAFADAFALLAYRYANVYNTLLPVTKLYGGPSGSGEMAFRNDTIDGYSDGSLQTTFDTNADFLINNNDNPTQPWAGANNTNHYFTHQDLFDPAKTEINVLLPGFIERLSQAGTNVSTYGRYTFYRLLSQLGTDSTPESGKMNLNYDNINPYTLNAGGVPFPDPNGIAAATNFAAWQPLAFFTNAADRLLRAYTAEWRKANPTNFAATFYSVNPNDYFSLGAMTNNSAAYPAFGIGNIPVLLSNQFVYSTAVNRLLQLAANMYDATINNYPVMAKNYPSVFRPLFSRDGGGLGTNVYITGFTNVIISSLGASDPQLNLPVDTLLLSLTNINVTNLPVNVYGVPWIVGAKKGFPNFNEFSFESIVQVTRKLEITRPSVDAHLNAYQTNQMYILSISNSLGVECWNSYSSNYTSSQIQIVARDSLSMMLTNVEPGGGAMSPLVFAPTPYFMGNTVSLPVQAGLATWSGSAPWVAQRNKPASPNANSFDRPLTTFPVLLTNSIYVYNTHQFIPAEDPTVTTNYVDKGIQPMPEFRLQTTNHLQVFMLDQDSFGNYHVIDYVQFAGPEGNRNLNSEIADYDPTQPNVGLWNTNFFGMSALPYAFPNGVVNQIEYAIDPVQNASLLTGNDSGKWIRAQDDAGVSSVAAAVANLNAFLNPNHKGTGRDTQGNTATVSNNTNLFVQVPFTPTRVTYQYVSWQANDPLVHYVAGDLNFAGPADPTHLQPGIHQFTDPGGTNSLPPNNLGQMNDRYQPWGISLLVTNTDASAVNLAYKDPLVRQSDNWDFPTNKFPTVGWLGRVHRGTPWQTVYLKASDVLGEIQITGTPPNATTNYLGTNTWANWTGNFDPIGCSYTAPVQDRLMFDLFTTAFNDNATRGTLSVNQNQLAAWSALLSGVVVITNNAPSGNRLQLLAQYQTPPPSNSWLVISPAGIYNPTLPWGLQPAVVQILQGTNGINQTRTNTSLFPLQAFEHVGDILAVPALTERSPFLNWNDAVQQQNGISDEMYEWLPQQMMSLLRVSDSPRYVIYCYGQTLKPAPNGIYGSSPYFGLVTNYQVVAEIAARAVVRFNSTMTNAIVPVTTNGFIINYVSQPTVTNNNAVIESFNLLPPD